MLAAAIEGTQQADQRIEIFYGATPVDKREAIKQAFNTDPAKHPVRILLATDAAREGLNLQAFCSNLFHFDVPWNPSRLEQRNGRIDRKLQPAAEVFCHYFRYLQRPEDRIIERSLEKQKPSKTNSVRFRKFWKTASLQPSIAASVAPALTNSKTRLSKNKQTQKKMPSSPTNSKASANATTN